MQFDRLVGIGGGNKCENFLVSCAMSMTFGACHYCQGLLPEISADEIAAEELALEETNANDDHEEGELESSPSQHKDLDLPGEDTRTTTIRRIVYVS